MWPWKNWRSEKIMLSPLFFPCCYYCCCLVFSLGGWLIMSSPTLDCLDDEGGEWKDDNNRVDPCWWWGGTTSLGPSQKGRPERHDQVLYALHIFPLLTISTITCTFNLPPPVGPAIQRENDDWRRRYGSLGRAKVWRNRFTDQEPDKSRETLC